MMTPFSKAQAAKLGSDGDPIRQALFACQPMNQLLQGGALDGITGPFQTIADAAKLAGEGKKEEARTRLRSVLSLPELETRVQLWVWSALRELAEQPAPKLALEILGVVLEVPVQGAYDTLAAYKDGTVRYLNFSGSAIFWDMPDPVINGMYQLLVSSTLPASSRAKPRVSVLLPKSGLQVTLLTPSGIRVIPDPPETVAEAAARLMTEVIRCAKARIG